jgi:hypothetical protein
LLTARSVALCRQQSWAPHISGLRVLRVSSV